VSARSPAASCCPLQHTAGRRGVTAVDGGAVVVRAVTPRRLVPRLGDAVVATASSTARHSGQGYTREETGEDYRHDCRDSI